MTFPWSQNGGNRVGKNLVMKRFASRARGRSSRILKPFSEITIVVREAGEAA